MASVNQVPRESFRALVERTRYQRKKVIIVEGKDDYDVYHHHLTNAEKSIILCKEIKTINMPNIGRGNVATIKANASNIKDINHISAIIDSDVNVYGNHHDFMRYNESNCLFSSSGYSIENYALAKPEEISKYFGDLFLANSDKEKWAESIMMSIKCFHILSLSYFLESERHEINYNLVRASGGKFLNRITNNNITTDNYLETLKDILVQESISTDSYEELKSYSSLSSMKIDGKLVSKCIRLAFYACGCSINNFSNNEMDRRLIYMIGVEKHSSHLSKAINSLVENNSNE